MNTPLLIKLGFIAALLVCAHPVAAQQWPAHQTPLEKPVPQYQPNKPAKPTPQTIREAPIPEFFQPEPPRQQVRPPASHSGEELVPNPLSRLRNPGPQSSKTPARSAPPARETLPLPQVRSVPPSQNRVAPPTTKLPAKPRVTPPHPSERSPSLPGPTSRPTLGPAAKNKPASTKPDKKLPVLDFSIYRDRNPYPIDPRKPCQLCTCGKSSCQCKLLGNHGTPYRETEPGGCQCDTRNPWKRPDFSIHWPRPFSANFDEKHPNVAARRYYDPGRKRVVDVFDKLSTFKLIDYQREDNGHCGPDSDPYGCLGQSKLSFGITR